MQSIRAQAFRSQNREPAAGAQVIDKYDQILTIRVRCRGHEKSFHACIRRRSTYLLSHGQFAGAHRRSPIAAHEPMFGNAQCLTIAAVREV